VGRKEGLRTGTVGGVVSGELDVPLKRLLRAAACQHVQPRIQKAMERRAYAIMARMIDGPDISL
jgi:hypothetical protein